MSKIPLKIMTQNIRSISHNFDAFEVLLKRLNIECDLYILTESWNSKVVVFPAIQNYDTHFSTSNYNQNDGIVVYTKMGLRCSVEEAPMTDATCMLIRLDKDILIIANFLDSLNNILIRHKNYSNILLIGDININIIPDHFDTGAEEYLDLLASHGMLPNHTFRTRKNNCLDHSISRSKKPVVTTVMDTPLTDHCAVIVGFNLKQRDLIKEKTMIRTDLDATLTDINKIDFSQIMSSDDPEWCSKELVNILSKCITSNTTKKAIPRRMRNKKPWITPGLIKCIQKRDQMHRDCKLDETNENLKITYTNYKNYCNDLLKRLKKNYEKNELQRYDKDTKMTWRTIKKIANLDNQKPGSSNLLNISHSPESSVNLVNDYFANVGRNLASKIVNNATEIDTPCHEQKSSSPNSMVLEYTSESEVNSILLSLKSECAVGWDGIGANILKMARDTLVPIITHIFNLCICKGIFPRIFKIALIHPIHKSGDRECASNYRPIVVLPTLSKLLEKIMNKRLISFLNENSIISENQFGFRAGRSTEDAVSGLSEHVAKLIDSKQKCLGIFLDLAKAFDTVSVPILLAKMEYLGIRGIPLKLFTDYLTNRSQRVTIDKNISSDAKTDFGVPQGSVIGPSLFLIYINGLCKLNLKNAKTFAFADDTALIFHGKTWEEARSHAEVGLSVVMRWLTTNVLTLNDSKTNYITFGINRNLLPLESSFKIKAHKCHSMNTNASCSCDYLERSTVIKYLGVLLDESFTWKPHVHALANKTRRLMPIFRKLRTVADPKLIKSIYCALGQSIMTYCIRAWGGTRKSTILPLERAQRSLLKVANFKPYRYPTQQLLSDCNVLSVRQLYVKEVIKYQHKFITYRASRRKDNVCKTIKFNTYFITKFQCSIAPRLYNKLNKILEIYKLNSHKLSKHIEIWLKTLNYDETEKLLAIIY